MDTLFPPVTKDEALTGSVTYRCFYVTNDGMDTLQTVNCYLEQGDNISDTRLGANLATEIQQIILSGDPIGGTFRLTYTAVIGGSAVSQETYDITFDPDPDTMANNIQTALNDLTHLSEVTATAQFTDAWRYNVTFGGVHSNRLQRLLEVTNNAVTGGVFTVASLVKGSPINAIAPSIGFDNQPPNGVAFVAQSAIITIGDILSLDGFSLWLKRTTPAVQVNGTEQDHITVNVAFS